MIVLDLGSANTCKNDVNYARRMILEIAGLNIPGIVVKWQLFKQAGDNIPLSPEVFDLAYRYAAALGIGTTASVFDKESLDFLLTYNVPFIKIANQKASKDLIKFVPENIPLVISTDDANYKAPRDNAKIIYCISQYPADKKEYEKKFGDKLSIGMSDHTTDFTLFKKYQPKVYECHFKLKDSTGLDAGEFARTPDQIKEMLKMEIKLEDVLAETEKIYNDKVGL